MLGKTKMFKFGLGLFTVGSLLCGITGSFTMLILARIVQAVGAATWEYIFLINVPIGLIALFYAVKLLPKGHKTAQGKMDGLSSVLFMFTIVPLFVALSEGLSRGFTDPIIP